MFSIQIQHISKSFGATTALNDIELHVHYGELFGLIGSDGAGKSTLIRVLTTLLLPDTGTAEVLGYDVIREYKTLRKLFGYMPGRFSLYQDLTVEENLTFFATIFNTSLKGNYASIRRIYQYIEPFKNRKAGDLSGGMKQKLALCCALIHKPKILFLDEPTTGVDAVSRREFWDLLSEIRATGLTIFVSTPYMDEASRCDRIALIQNGSILKTDTPGNTINEFGYPLFAVSVSDKYAALLVLRAWDETDHVYPFGDTLHIRVTNKSLRADTIQDYLKRHNISGRVKTVKPGIEDVFIQLMESTV